MDSEPLSKSRVKRIRVQKGLPMDSELQADLDRWDDPLNPRSKAQTARIVEAARKVANPDIDTMRRTIISAGIELQNQERNITWPEWANELLTALGITEDTG